MKNNNVIEFNNDIDFEAVVDALLGESLTDKQQRSVDRFLDEREEAKDNRKIIPFRKKDN